MNTCRLFGRLAWLALASAAAAAEAPESRPLVKPRFGNAVNVSWGDHIMVFQNTARLDTSQRIQAAMRIWKDRLDARTIIWRVSGISLERDFVFNPDWHGSYRQVTREIFARFDPVKAAVAAAHANGLKILAYLCIYDEGNPPSVLYGHTTSFPWQSKFTIGHPEFLVVDREQKNRQFGVLEYAYAAARRYKVNQFRWFVENYGFDGIYVCTRSHSPPAEHADQFGFNKPIVREFQKRYGVNILTEPFDRDAWRRLRGQYLTQLFRDLRAALGDKTIFAAIPRGRSIGPPDGNMTLDWETWVADKLVDGLVIGVISGKWLYPNQARSDKDKGYLCSQEEGLGMRPLREDVEGVYGPVCTRHRCLLFVDHPAYPPADAGMLAWNHLSGLMPSAAARALYVTIAFVPDHPALWLQNARFTIEFWLNVRNHTEAPRILSKYDHTLADDRGRGWEVMLTKKGNVILRLNDGRGDVNLTSDSAIPTHTWTHVACVSEGAGGKLRIYVDGKQDLATASAPAQIRRTPGALYFAQYGNRSAIRRLDGAIDEVRIADVPLRFDRVPAAPYRGDEPETVALWHFDEVSDTEAAFRNASKTAGLDGRFQNPMPEKLQPSMPDFGRALNSTRP